ncbi:putative calcium-binding protein CML13 [Bienertia sinuspersici]
MGKDLTDDQIRSMKDAFTLFDTDNDGKITPSRLGILVFLDLMSKYLILEPFNRQLRYTFKALDKERTGYVAIIDLKNKLKFGFKLK